MYKLHKEQMYLTIFLPVHPRYLFESEKKGKSDVPLCERNNEINTWYSSDFIVLIAADEW